MVQHQHDDALSPAASAHYVLLPDPAQSAPDQPAPVRAAASPDPLRLLLRAPPDEAIVVHRVPSTGRPHKQCYDSAYPAHLAAASPPISVQQYASLLAAVNEETRAASSALTPGTLLTLGQWTIWIFTPMSAARHSSTRRRTTNGYSEVI